jgi:hypothetical protein
MTDIATFEAKCASCGHHCAHPSEGDFSYGHAIFCTLDGRHYASVSAIVDLAPHCSIPVC